MDPVLAFLIAFLGVFIVFCFCVTVIALVALGHRSSEVAEKAITVLSDFGRQAIRKLSSIKSGK